MLKQFLFNIAAAASGLVLLALVSGLLNLMVLSEAEACSPMEEAVAWSAPADGDSVGADATVVLGLSGLIDTHRTELIEVSDPDGATVDGDEFVSQGLRLFQGMREFIPSQPLDEGEYTVTVDLPEQNEDPEETVEFSFAVDDNIAAADDVPAVEFDWYRELFDEKVGDTCHYDDEYHYLKIDPPTYLPDFYEVIFTDETGDESVEVLHPDEADQLQVFLADDVDCVTVSAGSASGIRFGTSEACTPDKCVDLVADDTMFEAPRGPSVDFDDVDRCVDPSGGSGAGGDEPVACSASVGSSVSPLVIFLVVLGSLALVNIVHRRREATR